ncbi:PTS glucose transporter subunit IIA [Bacillus megaterium]|uniref:PTS sugar transporter subunit IIA n=1 Tax=Priestia megaterium TaxID=1404 RepID=UPI001292D8CA|nr:PTS glucose transporter subunit IIA [Priestia megaterium]MQR88254.1 PTS glucose transporter subunit IIA [Priestia megaterium]
MFNIFKKKEKVTEIYSPVIGSIHNIETASDPVFKQKIMGDGFYVLPHTKEIYAPMEGVIDSIFPTKHAFTMKTDSGISVLVHIGTDTVQLEGIPFELSAEEGDYVKPGDLLCTADFEYIKDKGKGIEVYVVFPELDDSKKLTLTKRDRVSNQDIIGTI